MRLPCREEAARTIITICYFRLYYSFYFYEGKLTKIGNHLNMVLIVILSFSQTRLVHNFDLEFLYTIIIADLVIPSGPNVYSTIN